MEGLDKKHPTALNQNRFVEDSPATQVQSQGQDRRVGGRGAKRKVSQSCMSGVHGDVLLIGEIKL